jgi:hypothetical protein
MKESLPAPSRLVETRKVRARAKRFFMVPPGSEGRIVPRSVFGKRLPLDSRLPE